MVAKLSALPLTYPTIPLRILCLYLARLLKHDKITRGICMEKLAISVKPAMSYRVNIERIIY